MRTDVWVKACTLGTDQRFEERKRKWRKERKTGTAHAPNRNPKLLWKKKQKQKKKTKKIQTTQTKNKLIYSAFPEMNQILQSNKKGALPLLEMILNGKISRLNCINNRILWRKLRLKDKSICLPKKHHLT